jgi:hypothetical protein
VESVQDRALNAARPSSLEVLGGGSTYDTQYESTRGPASTSAVAQPGEPNKAARNREFVANLVVPASARPTDPEHTLTYSDLAAVEHALAQAASDWAPPSSDPSIPTTAA